MMISAIIRILTTVGVEYLEVPGYTYVLAYVPGDKRISRRDTYVTMYPEIWSLKSLRLWLESIRVIRTLSDESEVMSMIKLQGELHMKSLTAASIHMFSPVDVLIHCDKTDNGPCWTIRAVYRCNRYASDETRWWMDVEELLNVLKTGDDLLEAIEDRRKGMMARFPFVEFVKLIAR